MYRQRFLRMSFLIVFILSSGQAIAQSTVQVALPIHGYHALTVDDTQLVLIDTFTGETQVLDEVLPPSNIAAIQWDPQGEQIAYLKLVDVYVLSPFSPGGEPQLVFSSDLQAGVFWPQQWSPNGTHLLGINSLIDWDYYELQTLNVSDGTRNTLLHYDLNALISEAPQQAFHELRQADWNPVFDDWIVVRIGTGPVGSETALGEVFGTDLGVVYNQQTGQRLLLNDLFNDTIGPGVIRWSPDGRYLFTSTGVFGDTLQIIELQNTENSWQLVPVTSINTELSIIDWLGVNDLLLVAGGDTTTNEYVFSVGQILDGDLLTAEFFRITPETFGGVPVSGGSWLLTASYEEQQMLSHLFGG